MNNNKDNGNLISRKKIAGRYLLAILSFVILVIIDQLTKYHITSTMKLHDSIPVIENVFEIHYIQNRGAAWGMLENQQGLFIVCTSIACIFGVIFYIQCAKSNQLKALQICLVLILAGAVGNFIDRITVQYVIDFLYFKLIDFPVFNIADCYVTIGFFVTIILILFIYKEEDLEVLSLKGLFSKKNSINNSSK